MIAMASAPSEAQQKAPDPIYHGAGALKCSRVIKNTKLELELSVTWAQGYLNALENSVFEFDDIKTYIIRYCYLHPSHITGDAILIYYVEHAKLNIKTTNCVPYFLRYPPPAPPQPSIPP